MHIYKQKIPFHGPVIINYCRRILSVGVQVNEPVIWYIHDILHKELTKIQTFFTGQAPPEPEWHFVGTFQLDDHNTPLVGHVFTI